MTIPRPPGACQILDDGLTISCESLFVNTERALRPRLVVIWTKCRTNLNLALSLSRVSPVVGRVLRSLRRPRRREADPDRARRDHRRRSVVCRCRPRHRTSKAAGAARSARGFATPTEWPTLTVGRLEPHLIEMPNTPTCSLGDPRTRTDINGQNARNCCDEVHTRVPVVRDRTRSVVGPSAKEPGIGSARCRRSST